MKTLQEMIEARQQKTARMSELIELRSKESRRFTDDERTEFESLETEVSELDEDIGIKRYEEKQAGMATAVQGRSTEQAHASRGGLSFVRKTDPEDSFRGQSFTRRLIAKAVAYAGMRSGEFITPGEVAQHRWGNTHPNLVNVIKMTGVPSGSTKTGEWGAELAQSDTRYTDDFIEFLYSLTVFDRLPLRPVPANIHIKGQDGAASAAWVGQLQGIPVTRPDFSDVDLRALKVAAIAACSKELIADSSPSAEMWIRDSIAQASAQRVDQTFLSAAPAVSGVSPAGILDGVNAIAPSGGDAAHVIADLQTLYAGFLAAKNSSGVVQVMTPGMAKAISLMFTTLGVRQFPGINSSGGELLGDPVFTGDNVTGGHWILLKPSDIWKIGDTGIDVSMSDSATIEQDTTPAGEGETPTAMANNMVSLWQTEQVGFKIVRRINFQKRRASAVAWLDNAEYGGVHS